MHMNQLQKIQLIIAVGLTVISGTFWILSVNNSNSNFENQDEQPSDEDRTSYAIYFEPKQQNLGVGETSLVELVLNSDRIVSGIELFITYDSQVISIESVEKTQSFSLYIGEHIDNETGLFSFGAANIQPYVMKDQTILTLHVLKKAEGDATITLEESISQDKISMIIFQDKDEALYSEKLNSVRGFLN